MSRAPIARPCASRYSGHAIPRNGRLRRVVVLESVALPWACTKTFRDEAVHFWMAGQARTSDRHRALRRWPRRRGRCAPTSHLRFASIWRTRVRGCDERQRSRKERLPPAESIRRQVTRVLASAMRREICGSHVGPNRLSSRSGTSGLASNKLSPSSLMAPAATPRRSAALKPWSDQLRAPECSSSSARVRTP
jgi:hypothetical protein